jgi:glycosyltransferase involved in cell wall biosynthesis
MAKEKNNRKLQVCYVLSYKAPNYTRTATLLAALRRLPNVELTVIRNSKMGIARYFQTFTKLWNYRLHHKPDVFIVGFRGQETFALFYPFMRGSKIIFDEFINMHDWLVNEHQKLKEGSIGTKILDSYMYWIVKRSNYILADTPAHARLSAGMYGLSPQKVVAVPVGAEEDVFRPSKDSAKHKTFEVFFYGNMLPLHGLTVILEAIKYLAEDGRISGMHFTLVGGRNKPQMMQQIEVFLKNNNLGLYVTHLSWVDYQELPEYIAKADICLGGPFGGTGQAKRVITGKTYQFMAMGKPVIIGRSSNAGIFHDKHDSIIVQQGNPVELASAISWCKENRDELKNIRANALVLYKNSFSAIAIKDILRPLIKSV